VASVFAKGSPAACEHPDAGVGGGNVMDVEPKRVRPRSPKRVKLSAPPPLERLDDDWFDLPAPLAGEPQPREVPPRKSC
jgi:hypothetical protein